MKHFLLYFFGLALLLSQSSCGYNTIQEKDQNVQKQWAAVQSNYQRRTDLFNNVVNTIKGSAKFEQSTLKEVVEARAKATSVQLSADQLTPENIKKFQESQAQISAGIGRLLAVQESYPELQSTNAFRDFQAQIEGTENRIGVARNDYNTAVSDYNTYIKQFPTNLFASLYGAKEKTYFAADEASQKAPDVQF